MTYHHGWLYIDDQQDIYRELFNHSRTAAYLQNSEILGCAQVYNVLEDGGCTAYRFAPIAEPLLDEGDGSILIDPDTDEWLIEGDGSPVGWLEQHYTNPVDDDAPWYNPAYPESGDAIGFWITEWTGLDSGHIRREVMSVNPQGGQFGRTYSAHREMGFEVILLGGSEEALDYLFRWLDATIASVCATCETDSILIRRVCPEVDPLDPNSILKGVVELRKVGMIQGLTWGAPPVERAGCFIRSVNFTLGAMDPCMYSLCTGVEVDQSMDWEACLDNPNVNEDRANCRPACSEMDALCRTTFNFSIDTPGASGIVLTLTNEGLPTPTSEPIPLRIRTYANPLGLTAGELCGAPLLAELYVTALPVWSSLQYDMVGRQVLYRDAATGDWINGFAFIEPNDVGVPRFPGLACGDFTTIVEPSDFCYDYATGPAAMVPAMEMMIQERQGCS